MMSDLSVFTAYDFKSSKQFSELRVDINPAFKNIDKLN